MDCAGLIGLLLGIGAIVGLTDNRPLQYPRYISNGELSTARAASVLSVHSDYSGIHPEQITLAGYGEYLPVAANATPEGRARNRRVDIIVGTRAERP